MMEGTILPELSMLVGPASLVSRTLRVYGLAESRISELLDDLFHASSNPTVAYLAGGGEVHVRLTAKGSPAESNALLDPLEERVRERLGDHVYGSGDEPLEVVTGRLLAERGLTIACAESLTGGGLGERITAVAGASAYFLGSAVTYALEAKRTILGVSDATLEGPGPVSRECAGEMASGLVGCSAPTSRWRSRGGRSRAPRRRGPRPGLDRARRRGDRTPARVPLAVRPRARPPVLRAGGARPGPAASARPPAPGLMQRTDGSRSRGVRRRNRSACSPRSRSRRRSAAPWPRR